MTTALLEPPTTTESVEAQIKHLSLVERLHLLSVLAMHQEMIEDGIYFIGDDPEAADYTVVDALREHPFYEASNTEIFNVCESLSGASDRALRALMVTLALQIAR